MDSAAFAEERLGEEPLLIHARIARHVAMSTGLSDFDRLRETEDASFRAAIRLRVVGADAYALWLTALRADIRSNHGKAAVDRFNAQVGHEYCVRLLRIPQRKLLPEPAGNYLTRMLADIEKRIASALGAPPGLLPKQGQ